MSTRQVSWRRRRPAFRWWKRQDHDFRDEISSHIDLEIERLVADGMDPRDARDRARRAFGNVTPTFSSSVSQRTS